MKIDENNPLQILQHLEEARDKILEKIDELEDENYELQKEINRLERSKKDKFSLKKPRAPKYSSPDEVPSPKFQDPGKEPSKFMKSLASQYESWHRYETWKKVLITMGIFFAFAILNLILYLTLNGNMKIGALVLLIICLIGIVAPTPYFLFYVIGRNASYKLLIYDSIVNENYLERNRYEQARLEASYYRKYLKDLNHYNIEHEKFKVEHKDINGRIKTLELKIKRNLEEIEKLLPLKEQELEFLPSGYQGYYVVNYLINILLDKRARNLTEMINVYEDDMHKRRLEKLAGERIVAEERNIAINRERLEREEKFHQSELRKMEKANIEAARHNAEEERISRQNEIRNKELENRETFRRLKTKCHNCPKYGICNLDPVDCSRVR